MCQTSETCRNDLVDTGTPRIRNRHDVDALMRTPASGLPTGTVRSIAKAVWSGSTSDRTMRLISGNALGKKLISGERVNGLPRC
jgi:hypothetical protein